MGHELAIEVIQDRIIYLTGQIQLTTGTMSYEISEKVVLNGWKDEINNLKESQKILYNKQRLINMLIK